MEIVRKIIIKTSSANTTPPNLSFGELAFSDVGGVKKMFIGDRNDAVHPLALSDFDNDLILNEQGIDREVLTEDKILTINDKPYCFYDPNGVNRNIHLPSNAELGRYFCIKNIGNNGDLIIWESGNTIGKLGESILNDIKEGLICECFFDSLNWIINFY